MKKTIFAISAVALSLSVPASAADLAARPYTKAPPPMVAPIYDWTGFYIGANGGWAESRNCWDFITTITRTDGCTDRSGGVIGGQIGYRWQANQFVFGLEAQGDWADIDSTRASVTFPGFSTRVRLDGIGLFTGQIGWAWNAALLYVKGGAAVTDNRFDVVTTACCATLGSAGSTRWGGTVGVGFEYGFTPNWSFGVEYDHLFMGHDNNSFTVVNPVFVGVQNRIDQDVDMITLRLNYRFGGFGKGPVAARY
jgi:outer membrane immunogenic protein